jgi:hypothetical protein
LKHKNKGNKIKIGIQKIVDFRNLKKSTNGILNNKRSYVKLLELPDFRYEYIAKKIYTLQIGWN